MGNFRRARAFMASAGLRGVGLVLLGALAGAFAAGCGPCGRSSFTRAAVTARTTVGPYRTARVDVSYIPAHAHGDGASSARVRHVMRFEGEGRRGFVVLGESLPPSHQTCEPTYALSFAPDGRVAALSDDGGHGWRYVGLDGEKLVYAARGAPTVVTDPWVHPPTTRELVLEALRSGNDPTTARQHSGGFDWHYGQELEASAQFACGHLDDPELRAALSDALTHVTAWRAYGGGQHDAQLPLLLCASNASRTDPTLRPEVQRALAAMVRDGRGGAAALRPYALGCHAGGERPGDQAIWCLAKEALDAQPTAAPR